MRYFSLKTLLVSLIVFVPCWLTPVIIIIHGSFSSDKTWWSAQGHFFAEVEQQAKKINQTVVPFSWSGTPTDIEIRKAGENLAKLILSYPVQEQITIIAHSHGGNIVNVASTEISARLQDLNTSFSQLSLTQLLDLVYQRYQEKPYEPASSFFALPTHHVDDLELIATIRTMAPHQKKYPIDMVYMLAVPIDQKQFRPSMNVIGNILNCYSSGDFIQPVLGYYGRKYPSHERISNVEVSFKDHASYEKNPGHSQIHSSIVGKWLLYIPHTLAHAARGGFDAFNFGVDGKIVFDIAAGPLFTVYEKTKEAEIKELTEQLLDEALVDNGEASGDSLQETLAG